MAGDPPFTADPEKIRQQVAQILASEVFARSERMSRFLTFLVQQVLDGRADELKESVIGVEVYDRPPDYNPKVDPIVRNEARRLRAKLREYYATHGLKDALLIDLPKGTYVPAFHEVTPSPLEGTEASTARRPSRWPWTRVSWKTATGVCVVLLLVAVTFFWRSRSKFISTSSGDTKNSEALAFYEKGQFLYRQGQNASAAQQRAAGYFQQAIAKDPNYAQAYIGLSNAELAFYVGTKPDSAVLARADDAVRKALKIDTSLGPAHLALGEIFATKHEWTEADREFRKALELDPQEARAHLTYATVDLALTDRLDAAIEEANRALVLDPVSPDGYGKTGLLLLCARRYDEAIQMANKDLELHPQSIGAQTIVGRAYVQQGKLQEAEAAFAKAETMGRRAHWAASLASLYVKLGRRADAEKMARDWAARPSSEFGHAESMAMIYAALSRNDEAIRWLDLAYRDHWPQLAWIKIEPEYDNLQNDPSFSALLERLGVKSDAPINPANQ